MSLKLDSLVRGAIGHTNRVETGRVYRLLPTGVAVITTEGKQAVIDHPEVIGDPRPVISRGDIPHRLRS
jgi:hypothetical protein